MTRALTETEYRLLVQHSPVMTWRAGLDAKCDYFNDTWLKFTGRTLELEQGDGWAEGVHADDLQRCVDYYLDHFQRREAFEMEYRLRRHDGEYRWIFDRGVPFNNDSGAFAGFIGSCVDVHDRRQAQEAQQQHTQEQLILARDFEKWILAIVGHDIRNPLHTIKLASMILQKLDDPTGKVKAQAGALARASTRIENIVGDLLDLSRERDGSGLPIDPKATDLRGVCQQIVDEVKAVAQNRVIQLDCETDAHGTWDGGRLSQAISNLANNALQHGQPGTPVLIRVSGSEQNVAVEVRNSGVIPEELLPVIFEPFRSGRDRVSRGDGLGIGLFIARAIAHAHGGSLEVQSKDNETSFKLKLPRTSRSAVAS